MLSLLPLFHRLLFLSVFFFTDTATPEIYTLSLHDALPIYAADFSGTQQKHAVHCNPPVGFGSLPRRSEEHTSELQSLRHLVCRLLLEKKNKYAGAHADSNSYAGS